ncbi:uncharacterized protein LOC141819524, partial [Curcuma longa]|uniref:uncharacterized protein LOC141819524 n=1 Tax=Curcuma longa TaxID=136217 RepID=UPI003D9E4AA3
MGFHLAPHSHNLVLFLLQRMSKWHQENLNSSSTEGEEPNDWLSYIGQSQEEEAIQSDKEEAAHVSIEQMERMEYPILQDMIKQVEQAFSSTSAVSRYNPPQEPLMGQVNYPPAQNRRPEDREPPAIFNGRFKAKGYSRQPWTLPSAQTNEEVISRWESITNNLVNQKVWVDNTQKVQFIENLLGENEKKMWIQWRMAYAPEYEALVQHGGGQELWNSVTSSQEDQIRSYRRMARLRYEAQRRLHGGRNEARTLESQLNPEAELELSQRRRASLVPAETLYSSRWSEPRHRVYQHYSETRILVTGGQQNLPLINQESYTTLRREGMQLVHLGLVMIRVHALHRRNAGVNALVVLRDTRWTDDRSIIGTMEIDLSEGTQLVYIAPNMLISLEDFYHHIELAIQTHGYEGWNTAESNLLITRGLIGRLTNTSHAGFRYNVQNVADYLASAGIHAVSAAPRTTAELQGMRWTLQPPAVNQVRIPQEVRTTTLMDGSVVLSFQGYQSARQTQPRRMSNLDIEEIRNEGEEEFIGMLSAQCDRKKERKKAKTCKDTGSLQNPQPIWDTLGWPSGKDDFL